MAVILDCVVKVNDILVAGHSEHLDFIFDGEPVFRHLLLVDHLDRNLFVGCQVFGKKDAGKSASADLLLQ